MCLSRWKISTKIVSLRHFTRARKFGYGNQRDRHREQERTDKNSSQRNVKNTRVHCDTQDTRTHSYTKSDVRSAIDHNSPVHIGRQQYYVLLYIYHI